MKLLIMSKEKPNLLFSIISGVDHVKRVEDCNSIIAYGDKEELNVLGLVNIDNANIEMED